MAGSIKFGRWPTLTYQNSEERNHLKDTKDGSHDTTEDKKPEATWHLPATFTYCTLGERKKGAVEKSEGAC